MHAGARVFSKCLSKTRFMGILVVTFTHCNTAIRSKQNNNTNNCIVTFSLNLSQSFTSILQNLWTTLSLHGLEICKETLMDIFCLWTNTKAMHAHVCDQLREREREVIIVFSEICLCFYCYQITIIISIITMKDLKENKQENLYNALSLL